MNCFYFLLAMTFFLTACESHEKTLYVSANTSNEYQPDGSKEKPYPNIENALQEIRTLRNAGNRAVINVEVSQGEYFFSHGHLLDRTMSDINILAAPGEKVIFTGGKNLPLSSLSDCQIGDNAVKRISLKDLGIEHYGTIKNVGFARPFQNAWAELFVNGKPMMLSRWPNEGMIPMGKILEKGSVPRQDDFSNRGAVMEYDSLRISSWEDTGDLWTSGYFNVGYADDAIRIEKLDKQKRTLTTDGPTLYGFSSGNAWNKWYAFNIKEETDRPGEYYLNRTNGELFFISPDSSINTLALSMLEEPFFDLREASNIRIEGITFEYSRAALIAMYKTSNVQISDCVFRNSGDLAIIMGLGIKPFKDYRHEGTGEAAHKTVGSLQQHLYSNQTFNREAGKNNLIEHCHFYNLGAGAISMGGGNRLTLEEGNNTVSNCLFHSNNRIAKSYRPAIHITGVGNKIINCEIFDTPSMAILMNGNNHLIKNNYIHDVCKEIEDQGAFYYGRNPSECGTIVENNLFANIPSIYSTCAIYHDDGAGALTVKDNILYQTGRYGVIMGGGSDNQYEGNLFIHGNQAVHVDNRLQGWAKALLQEGGIFEKRLREVNYREEPYQSAYPFLKDYWPNDSLPKRNVFRKNTFIGFNALADSPEFIDWSENDSVQDSIHLDKFDKETLLKELKRRKYRNDKEYNFIGIRTEN